MGSSGGTGGGGAPAEVVISFDDLPAGTVLTTQYPGLTFSSESGSQVRVYYYYGYSIGQTGPNMICTSVIGGGITCAADVYVDFDPAVSDIRIRAVQGNSASVIATIRLYQGTSLAVSHDVTGSSAASFVIDLTGYSGITRMEIDYIADANGMAWDDLRFLRSGK